MTASEEVRKLLDELGVEHDASEDDTTIFYDVDGNRYTYNVNPESDWAQLYGYNLTPAQAIAATLGRSCESCPEMDNPDSYIRHLSAALKGHDEHVPRPTNPCNMYTYGVLQGERPPDEVLFVGPDGGVTRYQTKDAGTCRNASKVMDEHGQARFVCSECHAWIDSRMLWNPEYRNGESPWVNDCKLNYCPNCGRRIEVDE